MAKPETFYDWVASLPKPARKLPVDALRAVYEAPHPRVTTLCRRLRKIVDDWTLIGGAEPRLIAVEVRDALESFEGKPTTEDTEVDGTADGR